jgi:hypothetical protein
VVPIGGGSVSKTPDQPSYSYGTMVTLNASASVGWSFAGWSGNASGFGNPIVVALTANETVIATFVQKPTLQMSPTGKTCRVYGENFTVTIDVSDVINLMNFTFEIRYNATLLRYVNVTWKTWGSGTVNEAGGTITGFTSGAATNGNQSLIMIIFQAARRQVWKSALDWINDLTDVILLQRASLSYPGGYDLYYARGGMNQINVGPDFAYTFSPIQGDVNNDGTVDIFDLRPAGAYYNVTQGDPSWIAASNYDLNGDGIIDTLDLTKIANNFGYTYNL